MGCLHAGEDLKKWTAVVTKSQQSNQDDFESAIQRILAAIDPPSPKQAADICQSDTMMNILLTNANTCLVKLECQLNDECWHQILDQQACDSQDGFAASECNAEHAWLRVDQQAPELEPLFRPCQSWIGTSCPSASCTTSVTAPAGSSAMSNPFKAIPRQIRHHNNSGLSRPSIPPAPLSLKPFPSPTMMHSSTKHLSSNQHLLLHCQTLILPILLCPDQE